MPYNRPGNIYYGAAPAGGVTHGCPTVIDGIPGIAVIQKELSATAGLQTPRTAIAGEQVALILKGIVQFANTVTGKPGGAALSAVKGSSLWINAAGTVISIAGGAGLLPLGKVVEIAGQRGTPTGQIRVNLDLRDLLITS